MHAIVLKQKIIKVRILFVILALSLTGCERDTDEPGSTTSINSLNILFSEISAEENAALSFNESNRASNTTAQRARFFSRDQASFEMETNRDLQGYEYLAYVAPNPSNADRESVFLLDYSLDARTRVRQLRNFSTICAIKPMFVNDDRTFEDKNLENSGLLNRNRILVETPTTGSDCDGERNSAEIRFKDNPNANDANTIRQTGQSFLALSIISYRSLFNEVRESFYLYSDGGSSVSLQDMSGETIWSLSIPGGETLLQAEQLDNDLVALRTDTKVYIQSVDNLTDGREFTEELSVPVFDQVFGTNVYTLLNAAPTDIIQFDAAGDLVVFTDGRSLIEFDTSSTSDFEEMETLNVNIVSFEIHAFDVNNVLVLQRFADNQSILRLRRFGGFWDTSLDILDGLSADLVELKIEDARLFVNTFNLGQDGSAFFWQAHFHEALGRAPVTLDHGIFSVARRVDKDESRTFVIGNPADQASSSAIGAIESPGLWPFYVSGETDEFDNIADLDDRIGTFGTDISYSPINSEHVNSRFLRIYTSAPEEGDVAINTDINKLFFVKPASERDDNNSRIDNVKAVN